MPLESMLGPQTGLIKSHVISLRRRGGGEEQISAREAEVRKHGGPLRGDH